MGPTKHMVYFFNFIKGFRGQEYAQTMLKLFIVRRQLRLACQLRHVTRFEAIPKHSRQNSKCTFPTRADVLQSVQFQQHCTAVVR